MAAPTPYQAALDADAVRHHPASAAAVAILVREREEGLADAVLTLWAALDCARARASWLKSKRCYALVPAAEVDCEFGAPLEEIVVDPTLEALIAETEAEVEDLRGRRADLQERLDDVSVMILARTPGADGADMGIA